MKNIVNAMSLEEKIGQKIMMDFRYWNQPGEIDQDMTVPNDDIRATLIDNHIGGVILFSNNLKTTTQIKALGAWFSAIRTEKNIKLFLGTDNEGGSVFRLPRDQFASFPGNMALGAAIQGGASTDLAFQQGKTLAHDMHTMHFNTDFAPVVDVNTNPLNPVINVRSFSDDANFVTKLTERISDGLHDGNMIIAFKHFPGHGDTATDSHTGLPVVHRSRQDAFAIDLAPYSSAIAAGKARVMIMTAQIQYPVLDNSTVKTKQGEDIIVPATMSHTIQTEILRRDFGFEGVTISDALTMMKAINDNFTYEQGIEFVFKAGVDIALMPVPVHSKADMPELPKLVALVAELVRSGEISEADIDASVERILKLKADKGLMAEAAEVPSAVRQVRNATEKEISDKAITLLANRNCTLPLASPNKRIFVLSLKAEQSNGIRQALNDNRYNNVVAINQVDDNGFPSSTQEEIKAQIDACDVFIMGTMTRGFSLAETDAPSGGPVMDTDPKMAQDYMTYAKAQAKTVVQVSLRAPYDFVYYDDIADAALVTYSFSGYVNGSWNGTALISLADILVGTISPSGKLPVNIWSSYDAATDKGVVAYPRGFGLGY